MATPGKWAQGASEIEDMLARGELEKVEPSEDHADLLLSQAQGHLDAADGLLEQHPPSAYSLLYEGARKAMSAVLAKQGLRGTASGGHVAVQNAIEAQLGAMRHVVRKFRQLRTRRHDSEYPSINQPEVTVDEAREGLADARDILDLMGKVVPEVGPFR